MARPQPQSFLLRLWREHPAATMRATLIVVGQPEQQRHFATLDALQAFLRAAGERGPEPDDRELPDCTLFETR